jgi:putative transposase
MGRPLRASVGGYIYHALNRGNGRAAIFRKYADFEAFERVLCETQQHAPGVRLLAYCLMPNHWHLVLWPKRDGELSDFMHWLTLTHTQRWHVHHGNVGGGHLYQGRFKSFPIQDDEHFLAVCRYVERNALRAGLVKRAEDWRWCSLGRRSVAEDPDRPKLSAGPLPFPSDWLKRVNHAQTEGELAAIRRCLERGRPYGGERWTKRTAGRLGLASSLRNRGRPRKANGF